MIVTSRTWSNWIPGVPCMPCVPTLAAVPTGHAQTRLEQLDGMRALATTWILLGHFLDWRSHRGLFTGFLARGNVPVCYYIVLSGFVTHWAYDKQNFSLQSFFRTRLGRIAFSYYFFFGLGLVQRVMDDWPLSPMCTGLGALMLEAWAPACEIVIQSFTWPSAYAQYGPGPNPAGWTIGTLIFCWVCYPVLAVTLNRAVGAPGEGRWQQLLGLAIVAYVLAVLPPLAMLRMNAHRPDGQRIPALTMQYLEEFPPCRLADFSLGVLTAALMKIPGATEWPGWPFVGWGAALTLVAIVLGAPLQLHKLPGHLRHDAEALMVSGPSALWALMIAAMASPHTRLTRHPMLIWVGQYSFAAYLLQFWLAHIFVELQKCASGHKHGLQPWWMLAFIFCVWTLASLYTEFVELPFVRVLRGTIGWAQVLHTLTRVVPAFAISCLLLSVPTWVERCLPMWGWSCKQDILGDGAEELAYLALFLYRDVVRDLSSHVSDLNSAVSHHST